jgi:hypothetical protein
MVRSKQKPTAFNLTTTTIKKVTTLKQENLRVKVIQPYIDNAAYLSRNQGRGRLLNGSDSV